MKERPILFSTPMVQAILAGNKTQTRRILKYQADSKVLQFGHEWEVKEFFASGPYGKIGDLLWVRESWAPLGNYPVCNYAFMYKANVPKEYSKWKPSIHMPKAAARIWLQIESIKVERLHDISEEDAIAEGVEKIEQLGFRNYHQTIAKMSLSAKNSFQTLWQVIHGEIGWNENPWVWAITFKVLSTTGKPQHILNTNI